MAKTICQFVNSHPNTPESQELILRACEYRKEFGSSNIIIDGLIRQIGLFPYIPYPGSLGLFDQIAYEAHRPIGKVGDVVFHAPQASVYYALLNGENVILAAPASFGKSLIIDALIATGQYKNIVIIVPNIALADETRRRLSRQFGSKFKLVTHRRQPLAEQNVLVGTQERILSMNLPNAIDLLVIDEFYKLSQGRETDEERCLLLNEVFYRLQKKSRQCYMLGPNVRELGPGIKSLKYREYFDSFRTVVSELHEEYKTLSGDAEKLERLIDLCKSLTDPTLIFCSSPKRTGEIAQALLDAGVGKDCPSIQNAADWIGRQYHPEWRLAKALEKGIGIHNGRISRALGQLIVREFNEQNLRFLICTSTLIEGVNTTARNMIIFDKKINTTDIDLFTFNNICGRSGRMFRHFVGHVYLFHPPPDNTLPIVDAPVLDSLDTAPTSLLIQMEISDLPQTAITKLDPLKEQHLLDYKTLQANDGIDPESQLALAKYIREHSRNLEPKLCWTGMPNYKQVLSVCELIWNFFDGRKKARKSVISHKQLALLIWLLSKGNTTKQLIKKYQDYNKDPNEAVEAILHFLRNWASFHFPRLLLALHRIQADIFSGLSISPGNYEVFAVHVEYFSLPSEIAALDEYGIPLELGRLLQSELASGGDLDNTLMKLKKLDVNRLSLSKFEKSLISQAQKDL